MEADEDASQSRVLRRRRLVGLEQRRAVAGAELLVRLLSSRGPVELEQAEAVAQFVLRILALDGLELARDARRRKGRRLEERTEAVQGALEIRRVDVEVVARVFRRRVGVRAAPAPVLK